MGWWTQCYDTGTCWKNRDLEVRAGAEGRENTAVNFFTRVMDW